MGIWDHMGTSFSAADPWSHFEAKNFRVPLKVRSGFGGFASRKASKAKVN